jgi:adenylate kinase
MNEPKNRLPAPASDLEIKDPALIFGTIWSDLEEKYGRDKLRFPREFIWLGGAPGAGKGTNTPFIAAARGITAPPIVVSSLLTTPEAQRLKSAGKMVGDRMVIELLLEELLKARYHDGVIVDGFPRTEVQAQVLKLFYSSMIKLHKEFRETPLSREFRKPMFRIAVLFVSEAVSVRRQLERGKKNREHNRLVQQTGIGELLEDRDTDHDAEKCQNRYRTFKETTYEALESLKDDFHYHWIDAEGDLRQVQDLIQREFHYQSSLELSQDVYELIHNIPIAHHLALHARQKLVERLEWYADDHLPLFQRVVQLVENKLMKVVETHAISGHTRINSEDVVFDDPLALRMMIDILSERGYHAVVDIHRMEVPERINPETWEIICRTKKVYRIEIRFQPSDIRRGH